MRHPQFLTVIRNPMSARSTKSHNLEAPAERLQQLTSLMERFGATKNGSRIGRRLKEMVGTWGLEPQTSTVSSEFHSHPGWSHSPFESWEGLGAIRHTLIGLTPTRGSALIASSAPRRRYKSASTCSN